MPPKFKYDPEQHCLREVARVKKPHHHPWADNTGNPISADKNADDWHRYNAHLSSLRVIPCAPWTKWPNGELKEIKDFTVERIRCGEIAIPKPPRTFTLAEAEEIWRGGYDCGHAEAAREDYIDKQQYFKTWFNVEL